MAKSWHLNRRTLIHGVGASLSLPLLDCMASDPQGKESTRPKRLCAMYFGFGVGLPDETGEHAQWRWFPKGEGRDYQFNESLKPLQPLRDKLTVLGGLSHPNGRKMGAHDTGDTFLTGSMLTSKFLRNSVSMDQVAAEKLGLQTRFPSLVLSTDGGVGEPTRSSTLSYNSLGRPIPALNQPQQIFDRFFGMGDADFHAQQRQLNSGAKMLDRVLEDSRSLRRRLGNEDQQKFDEYLASVREIEKGVERSQQWINIPRPELRDEDLATLKLDANDEAPLMYIRSMYDLIYLALRTDSTRVATYQITNMADASSKAGKFPQLEGFKSSLHTLAHDWNKPDGAEALGKWDRFMAQQFAYFLNRLESAKEGDGSVLDNSVILYGSSNSNTHNNNNYPLVLAGGNQLGFQHGRYLRFGDDIPLSNLMVTMLNRVGVQTEAFSDSTGPLSELLYS